jgi:excisionase family DNA binding protein
MQEYMSVRQASEKLKISIPTVYRLIRSGELPSVKLGGNVRIPADTLATRLEEQAAQAER